MADASGTTGRNRAVNALVILGHPAPDSLNHALAAAIVRVWQSAGCEVTFHDLVAEGFDPRLTATEAREGATTDPVVRAHIDQLRAADLLAVVHPNCWGAPPAVMKGWIDRVFAPNAAYAFAKETDVGEAAIGLLRTKAALIINTGNTPLDREAAHFGDPLDAMWRVCILGFCGVADVTRRLFGVVALSSRAEREAWIAETEALARALLVKAGSASDGPHLTPVAGSNPAEDATNL